MDKDTLELLKKRDKDAMEDVYNANVNKIYRYIASHITCEDAAQDITSTVFAKAFGSIDSFRGEAEISTWLYVIARNELYKYYTEKNLNQQFFAPIEEEEFENLSVEQEEEIEILNEEEQVEIQRTKEAKAKVALLFEKLPHKYAEVLRLRYLLSMTFKQIADSLSISKNYAKVLHNRAIKKANNIFQ